jgi:hypothetical protein
MKLKAHFETETYMTEGGYYAIKQDDYMGGREPSLILLKPDQIRALIKDMQEALKHLELFNGDEVEE